MKYMGYKNLLLVMVLACHSAQASADASTAIWTPRQVTTDATFELALTDYRAFFADDEYNFLFSLKPFYQQTDSPDRMGTYFMVGASEPCAKVRQDGTGKINPIWFEVLASGGNYSSTLCFAPVRQTYGAILTMFGRVNIFWYLINTAAMGATHNMHVSECNITFTGTMLVPGFNNMCDGLNNPAFTAGKIPCGVSTTKGGLDDIQIKLGLDVMRRNHGRFSFYAVGTIPTGIRPNAKTLFEPLVGSIHASLGAGFNADATLHDNDISHCVLLADVKYRYLLEGCERRTFDLCPNGDWARYLRVTTPANTMASQPGINFFTKPVTIVPRGTVDAWFAIHEELFEAWNLEVGYNLWWRQAEHLDLSSSTTFGTTIGIFDIPGQCAGNPVTASTATIAESFANITSDTNFVPLTPGQLLFTSAEQLSALSNKIYAAAAWSHDHDDRYTWEIGLGGSYEYATHNMFNQWALWLIGSIDF